jgi:uridine kinase
METMIEKIEKELSNSDRILKPDFNSKTGRELLAFYLQTKFKQILAYDKRAESPVFISVNPEFIPRFSKRLINSPAKRLLVGITGESASGKSTICSEIKQVIERLAMPVSILSTDNYFNDISALISQHGSFDKLIANGYDIDAPSSYQLDVLRRDLEALSQGEDIKAPEYVPNGTGVSVPASISVKSSKIVVAEGIASMFEEVRDIFDVRVYIEADESIRKERFLKRAVQERNQNPENALNQWNYLVETGGQYVKPCRGKSDFVLNGNSNLQYFSQILEYIHTITNNFH